MDEQTEMEQISAAVVELRLQHLDSVIMIIGVNVPVSIPVIP